MKELSIKEKAKRYDKAIEKLHEIITMDNRPVNPKEIGEYLFPELKESEDERIRKELVRAFTVSADKREHEIYGNGITYGQVLAWLEKQGEQKLLNNDKYQTVSVKILDRLYKSEKELERLKQNEQKTTNKAKPKFKVGDKINMINREEEDYTILTVTSINMDEKCYICNQGSVIDFDEEREWYKIEQKPAWSEEDEEMVECLNNCLDELEEKIGWLYVYVNNKDVKLCEVRNWLKSLKERMKWNKL